jgi:hypothetical protein
MPVMAIGSVYYMDGEVHREAKLFAENVRCEIITELGKL